MGDDPRPPALPGEKPEEYVRRITAPLGTPAPPRLTEDELRTLGPTGKVVVQGSRTVAKALGILAPALAAAVVASVGAYKTAVDETRAKSQEVKNKSEAGYQVTKPALEALERRVLVLEEAARRMQVATEAAHPEARAKARHRAASTLPPPVPVVVNAHPRPLPSNLDEAERQIYRGAPPSPPADGGAGVTGR